MASYYAAVDIGASSGRLILGWLEDGTLRLREVHRFQNRLVKTGGHLCWEIDRLFSEIVAGLKRCGELGMPPQSVGVDTWGVDYVLLDKDGGRIGDAVAYRDGRTAGMDAEVAKLIPPEELYARTGIQKQPFNTIYQLAALKKEHPEQLEQAARLLMVPDYFHYLLSGAMKNEYTNATTSQLVNIASRDWDWDLLDLIGVPRRLFEPVSAPGTPAGRLRPELRAQVGFDCEVVLPATHDTASAVMSVPCPDGDAIYLSSGTWSLIGIERTTPDCSEKSRGKNFTNEGGYDYRYRYLKNIMGLWMIQSVKRELGGKYTFDDLCDMAIAADRFTTRVDVNAPEFLAPDSMIGAVREVCRKSGQPVPNDPGELMNCIYHSLAKSYGEAVREIETLTGRAYEDLHIVGGGTKDDYLNRLTRQYTGKRVHTGPTEATVVGNLLAQMLRDGVFPSLSEARRAVANSFDIKEVRNYNE